MIAKGGYRSLRVCTPSGLVLLVLIRRRSENSFVLVVVLVLVLESDRARSDGVLE